jgi:hypothetical protein
VRNTILGAIWGICPSDSARKLPISSRDRLELTMPPIARPRFRPAKRQEGLPNSRRLRPGRLDAHKQSLLIVLRHELFPPGSAGEQLWAHGLVSCLVTDASSSLDLMPIIVRKVAPLSAWPSRMAVVISGMAPEQQEAMGCPVDWQQQQIWS